MLTIQNLNKLLGHRIMYKGQWLTFVADYGIHLIGKDIYQISVLFRVDPRVHPLPTELTINRNLMQISMGGGIPLTFNSTDIDSMTKFLNLVGSKFFGKGYKIVGQAK